ncbi:hypothetical protein I4U23_025697 [Adineta vaga]|nr:hypothetical protein I4U23_025697 [Adineta vaga]
MATATTTTDNPRAKEDESDVENWCVIWLDANASTEINQNEEEQLRPIVKHLKTFQDKASCRKYLKEQSKADKLKLIVSGKLGQQIVPAVHDLEQIASIYVYCIDCQNHIQWTKSHPKVKAVIDSFDQLLSEMKADRKNPTTVQYSLTIDDTGRTTGHLNAQSVYFQRLIDCFLELEYSLEDRNEFLDVYGDLDDEGKCKEIEEFRKSYSPQSAIKRYTQATFFYKDLNNAFRTMNYRTIFLYRSYIADIYRQLKENQSTTPLKVYRGQFMSKSEIKKLQRCRGQLISVGSFFSTSLHKETAQAFKSDKATDTLEPLLFEIDADPKMATTTPFAKISELSAFHQESEVLFMLGSIFRLDSIAPNDDGSGWNMKMTLCSENEHAFKDDLEYMKKQADNRQTNYQILGDLLFILREFNSARLCFTRHLDKLPENDTQRLKLYEDLEKLEAQAGFHNEGMKWQRKARAFQDQNPSTSIPSNTATTTTHINIAQSNSGCASTRIARSHSHINPHPPTPTPLYR